MVENAELIGEPEPDEMEDIEIVIMPEKRVLELIKNGTINHGLVLNALMFYMAGSNSGG